ncbi:MAG: hypothetical protein ABWY19_10870 [Marmoricola sp.]
MKHASTVKGGETVGSSSHCGELSSGGDSAEMISDGCPFANRKVLIKRVGENLVGTIAQDAVDGAANLIALTSHTHSSAEA